MLHKPVWMHLHNWNVAPWIADWYYIFIAIAIECFSVSPCIVQVVNRCTKPHHKATRRNYFKKSAFSQLPGLPELIGGISNCLLRPVWKKECKTYIWLCVLVGIILSFHCFSHTTNNSVLVYAHIFYFSINLNYNCNVRNYYGQLF